MTTVTQFNKLVWGYHAAKKAAEYHPNLELTPTATEQSQANDTDINVIVRRYGQFGTMPGAAKQPFYADFASIPDDLATAIQHSRATERLRDQLPPELKELDIRTLLSLTPDDIEARLKKPEPPAPAPAGQPEEKK